jgi:hypothetical protein
MGKTAVDKHATYDGPGVLREQRGSQTQKIDCFSWPYQSDYEYYDI